MKENPPKPVPDKFMKDYVNEVMRKAHAPAPFPYLPVFAFALVLAFAIAGAAVFVVVTISPRHREAAESSRGDLKTEIATSPRNDEKTDAARFDRLAQEIFILEMLGEDTGIDNRSRLQSDVDILSVAT